MGIVRTLARVLLGFALACLVAGLVQVLYVSTPAELAAQGLGNPTAQASWLLLLTLKTATHFAIFAMAFTLIAAGVAEWLSLRSPGYWLMIGVGIGLLGFSAQVSSEVPGQPTILNNYALQSFLTAGFFGGLTYWLVAGAKAGTARRHMFVDTPAATPRIVVATEASTVKKGSLAERLAWKRQKEATAQPGTDTDGKSDKTGSPEGAAATSKPAGPAASPPPTTASAPAGPKPQKASSVPIVRAAEQTAKPGPAVRADTPPVKPKTESAAAASVTAAKPSETSAKS